MLRYGPVGLHHGPHVLGWLFLVVLVGLLVVGIVALVRLWSRPRPPAAAGSALPPSRGIDPAITELRVRYARGDIDWGEFSRMAGHLGYPVAPAPGDAGRAAEEPASPTAPPA